MKFCIFAGNLPKLYNVKYYNNRTNVSKLLMVVQDIHFLQRCRTLCISRQTFLKIHYESGIDVKPNLIEGDSLLKTFNAGYYHATGQPLGAGPAVDPLQTITVRPTSPFSISSTSWSKYEIVCLYCNVLRANC